MNAHKPHIAIVDYGLGNLYSIERALDYVGASTEITDDPDKVLMADKIVLPGVGTFGDGMKGLKKRNLISTIKRCVEENKPMLAICLGMQLLLTQGEEFGVHKGLDIVKGRVVPMDGFFGKKGTIFKIPHIGWNKISYPRNFSNRNISLKKDEGLSWHNTILENLSDGAFVYFVHSNIVVLGDTPLCLAETSYCDNFFCSVMRQGNIYGCQFHPERSGESGLEIYRNFVFKTGSRDEIKK